MSTIASRPLLHRLGVPRIGAGTLDRVLLTCGILSSFVYVAANVAAGLVWHGYSFNDQAISELSAIGAPSRAVWIAFGVPYDVLLVAFAAGAWRCAGERRRVRVAAAALLAIGVIGAFWPPMHMRGEVTTLTDTLHVVWASVISVLIFVAVGFGAGAAGRRFRIYSIATIAALLVFGVLTFAYAPALAANQPTPWLGLVERINLGVYLAWVAVLSIVLLRARRARVDGASR